MLEERAGKRVADDETMVEEGQREPFSLGLDPQSQLRQLDSEWVLVDAVEAVHGDESPAERLGLALGEARLLALRRAARQVPHQLLVGIGQRGQPLAIPGGLYQGRLPLARR